MGKELIYWKMRNGKSISVDDMDLNHLRNVLKMIIRNANGYCEHCKYIVDNKEYPHRSMCPNNIVNSDSYSYRHQQFSLNGDMANEFHESYLSDEDDDRFEEDEDRF